jgi:hypothetical protein
MSLYRVHCVALDVIDLLAWGESYGSRAAGV